MDLAPKGDYPLNRSKVNTYIDRVSTCHEEAAALHKFFDVTKYVSFDELIFSLKCLITKFGPPGAYAACLFGIDWIPVRNKSNYWIYSLLLKLGLPPPMIEIYDRETLQEAISKGITKFIFFDDASFSGYQGYDTIYSTFLMHMLRLNYLEISVHLLLGYASQRALNIFNHILPGGDTHIVPLVELTQIHDLQTIASSNRVLKEHVRFSIIHHGYMKNLKELVDGETLEVLQEMGIAGHKIPIYFAHKMPDYISSYSEIYIGFTLREPYDMIPLITNSEEYYNRSLLQSIHTREEIEDLTRDAPCPPPPYK